MSCAALRGIRPSARPLPSSKGSVSWHTKTSSSRRAAGSASSSSIGRRRSMRSTAALIGELSAAIDAFEADRNIGCLVITGSDKAFAAGADIKEMADKSYHRRLLRRFRRQLGPRRACAQAGDRGGRGLRARRRLRACDAMRSHHRGRQCEIRPAGNQARRHSGHRRHAAPDARRRQGQGDGSLPHRPHDGCAGSRTLRVSSRAWCRPRA